MPFMYKSFKLLSIITIIYDSPSVIGKISCVITLSLWKWLIQTLVPWVIFRSRFDILFLNDSDFGNEKNVTLTSVSGLFFLKYW